MSPSVIFDGPFPEVPPSLLTVVLGISSTSSEGADAGLEGDTGGHAPVSKITSSQYVSPLS